MGTYLNPGNSGFVEILKSDYVDKTELIGLINSTIEKETYLCQQTPADLASLTLHRCFVTIMTKPAIPMNCFRSIRLQEMQHMKNI